MSFITDVTIKNTGAAQVNVPFTFGQVFAVGDLKAGEVVTGSLANGAAVALQCDVKASHADGSVRHMIISGVLPKANAEEAVTLQLVKAAAAQAVVAPAQAPQTAASVVLTIGADKYSASLADATKSLTWLAGSIANESIYEAPLKNAQGVAHPRLTVRFGVRSYSSGQARVEVVIENTKTFSAGSNETYNVEISVNGRLVYSKGDLTHYHHARWRNVVWTDMRELTVNPNVAYLIASKAVPNYDQAAAPTRASLAEISAQLNASNTGPMTIGPMVSDMGTSGGRGDIGLLPQWTVSYLLSGDKSARDVMMTIAEGSGTWPIHYRDENTKYPVRTDSEANKGISTHGNLNHTGPLPVPRALGDDWSLVQTPIGPDTAHQPSLVYVPYLLTGEYFYLEELHFWASSNPLGTHPGNSGYGAGLLRWMQVRGQAWCLRTLGHTAYATPDSHPLKQYFLKQLDNNLNFYDATYVKGNPNPFGAYDGSGESAFRNDVKAVANWQDDFLTSSFGHLNELGFEKAKPILQWKAKFPIGRMTAPGYCWIMGSPYYLAMSDGQEMKNPTYTTFAELYKGNFYDGNMKHEDTTAVITHPQGLKWADVQCGEQAQADWLQAASGRPFVKGQMWGYAASTVGYPANMQPALAFAADSGIENAEKAWQVFDDRAQKPDYRYGAQFAIVPRTVEHAANVWPPEQPYIPPPPPPPPIVLPAGFWKPLGKENTTLTVGKNTYVRYGAKGAYITKLVSGDFVATNAFFGGDPILGTVKDVEEYVVAKVSKIVSPSSTKLVKATKLTVCLFEADTLEIVTEFADVTASSKGVITLNDAAIEEGKQYAATVSTSDGKVVLVHFPLQAV